MRVSRVVCGAALLGAVVSMPALGQGNRGTPPSTVVSAVDAEISMLEKQLVGAAEAMPPERFDFTPESLNLKGSEFKGVRTFALQIKHVAADNFSIWAPIAGEPEPPGVNAPAGPDAMKSRAEIIKFLKDSFIYAHKAARNLTAENLSGTVDFRGSKTTRLRQIVLAMAHGNDHYGQMVEYLRMNGVVPGASQMKMPM